MRILYDSKKIKYKNPFGALKTEQPCSICIEIPVTCRTKSVWLMLVNDHTGTLVRHSMMKADGDEVYESYTVTFSLNETGLYFYHFYIETEESDFELYKWEYDMTNIAAGDKWQITCYDKDFCVSDSFIGKVMYQIFPDRFFRLGEVCAADKLEPYYVHENTDDVPDYLPDESGEILNCDFFGGNLKGICSKLEYIKSLGASIIYLNPIFMAYSNHRYDTCDYKRIDPLLGNEDDFKMLCDTAHKLGIRIILDGVFSHTGSNSVYFDQKHIFGNGAVSNPESPYRKWYGFSEYPTKYDSWWGISTLPCVNELCKDYMDFIINDEDSVIARWLRLGADGYRLDVADELPDEFIKQLRIRVKEIKPDSYVVGEVWEDASNKISYGTRRRYFSDGELDSVMNYVYKNAIIDFVMNPDVKQFEHAIMTIAENYPDCALHSLMNSLSTHDTMRIITCLSGADDSISKSEKASFRLHPDKYFEAMQRVKLAAFLQFMLPGNACIYYGDEIGMEGYNDPFNRGYFTWDKQNTELRSFFASLAKVKNSCISLQKGNIKFESDGDVLVFERHFKGECVRAIVNMSYHALCADGELLISGGCEFRGGSCFVTHGGYAAVKI